MQKVSITELNTLKSLFVCLFLEVMEGLFFFYGSLACFDAMASPDHLPATLSISCCHLSVQCLDQICGIPPNSTLLSTPRLSYRPSISETSSQYCLWDESSLVTTWTVQCSLFWCRNAGSTMSSHDLWIIGGSY